MVFTSGGIVEIVPTICRFDDRAEAGSFLQTATGCILCQPNFLANHGCAKVD
ncbi:hypothetical protein LAY57_12130 [Argonema antarcticum A004/B2]|uniref:hypothetical protein n=1 Tax=Argonema antarcticum TaxID=2942763 RepID=UPI0030D93FD7|nr:hypothetical protein [Argonema antarcticum A004/B2]